MADGDLSKLDLPTLSARLRALAGEERNVQADFLLHLDALDLRRGYAELGYPSLWEYCLRALHLREGAAGRRIGAMRVLRRFPSLLDALRDGRLCLSTLCVLGPVLTQENVEDVTIRAAYRTKAEVDAIAAAVRPRRAPAEGVRRVASPGSSAPGAREAGLEPVDVTAPRAPGHGVPPLVNDLAAMAPPPPRDDPRVGTDDAPSETAAAPPAPTLAVDPLPGHDLELHLDTEPPPRPSPSELRAVGEAQWSLRVTLDAEAKHDLETLTRLLGHKVPTGSLAAVLKEALRCAIEKHGVRRGAVAPARRRTAPAPAEPRDDPARPVATPGTPAPVPHRSAIPAEVRRQVWARDGGRCTFTAPDGTRCESGWQLELDHVVPWALGGSPTVDNVRLRCRVHNLLHAERVFGREHMERFRRPRGFPASDELAT